MPACKFFPFSISCSLTILVNNIYVQASPSIRFNKEGILLAVSTNENGIKILANSDGIRLLRTVENRSFDASRVASAAVVKVNVFLRIFLFIISMASLSLLAFAIHMLC